MLAYVAGPARHRGSTQDATMHISPEIEAIPDGDPTETRMGGEWDSGAIIRLVRRNSARGYMPSMLMLGRKESAMLRGHLSQAFSDEEMGPLTELHYAGLKVVETQLDSLVKVVGEKMLPEMERAMRYLPVWRQDAAETRWRFDAGI